VLVLNISEAYLLLGAHDEGIALIDEYMPAIERDGAQEQLAIAHILVSRHHEELGRLNEARRHMAAALDIYRSLGKTKHAGKVIRAMERLEEAGSER